MSLNGVSKVYGDYNASYDKQSGAKAEVNTKAAENTADQGATYESTINEKTDRKAIVAALKADAEARTNSFKKMVQDMLAKQGKKAANADDMWRMLASGNFTVDAKTAAKAKEEISEDGYWGVKQTSQRIFDMAIALSGGDDEKMDKMLDAFKKGFGEATKTWGKSLPDISHQTYDAVIKKFEDYKNRRQEEIIE